MKLSLIITLISTMLTGCGFAPRSQASFPASLHTLYFSPEKPYSPLTAQLKLLLRSMRVKIVEKTSEAPYSLLVSHDQFSYGRAEVVNANLPTTMNFVQTATISIQDNRTRHMVATNDFNTQQSLTLNANQIYTTNANDYMKQTLNREMTSLIYYWLTSKNIKNALDHATHT